MTSQKIKNLLWFAYFVALSVWGFCAYQWLAKQIPLNQLFACLDESKRPYVSDFVTFYNAALLAAACLKGPVDIYSVAVQADSLARLIAPITIEHPFYLQYPPFFFSLVWPLSCLDMLSAWLVWCGLGLTLLVVSAYFLIKAATGVEKAGKFTTAFLIIALLASYPTWLSVRLGQSSLYLVPGIVAFWLAMRRAKFFTAGIACGVTLIKLQYLPPVFAIGFILGGPRYVSGLLAIGFALLLQSYFIVGKDNLINFPHALLNGETGKHVSGVAAEQMQNLRGNLTLFFGDQNIIVPITSLLVFAGFLVLMAAAWWHYKKKLADRDEAGNIFRILAAISAVAMLIFSPHSHTQDYLTMVIPCYWLWFAARGKGALAQLILWFPLISWPFFMLLPLFQMAKMQPFFLWACALLFLAVKLYQSELKSVSLSDFSNSSISSKSSS